MDTHHRPLAEEAPAPARRHALKAGWLALGTTALLGLSGCASLSGPAMLSADVASYGEWAADLKPGTYRFERLPSQQTQAELQAQLEAAAAPALAAAGFVPAPSGSEAEFVVQLGARASRVEVSPWHDPLWWRGTHPLWRPGPGLGGRPLWPWPHSTWLGLSHEGWRPPQVQQEVALLIRDRRSGKPLYETRASTEGFARSTQANTALAPLFSAALKDFPTTGLNPRSVSVPWEMPAGPPGSLAPPTPRP
jgi:hypothetical protein